MKRTLIVGNWKMHLNVHEGSLLVKRLNDRIPLHRDVEVVLAPSMLHLQPLSLQIDRRKFRLAAQDAYHKDAGAYTGEVSFTMLNDLVHYVIVGHSSRRIYRHESLEEIRDKVQAAIRNKISPILCIGENRQEHAQGETHRVLHDQLTTALAHLTQEEIKHVVIAYEPVWAISTFDGEIAKPDEMQKVLHFLRHQIKELYGETAAQDVRIIYGGSVDHENAAAYLKLDGCDGLLPGAASLNYVKFAGIVESAHRLRQQSDPPS